MNHVSVWLLQAHVCGISEIAEPNLSLSVPLMFQPKIAESGLEK